MESIDCKFCGGYRQIIRNRCSGCAEPVTRAANTDKRKKRQCPKCFGHSTKQLEPGRFVCNDCSAVFEDSENFYHHDPQIALEKKERHVAGRKKAETRAQQQRQRRRAYRG